ncbi:MAG TPA: hypothetical protein VHE55_16005 [Fimbriimonadaceae bacterium]|nr:hypothetical protein [Fimbriimonadaceae bacterium]
MQLIFDQNKTNGKSSVLAKFEVLAQNREKRMSFAGKETVSVIVDGPADGFGLRLIGKDFEQSFEGSGFDKFDFQVDHDFDLEAFEFFDFATEQRVTSFIETAS